MALPSDVTIYPPSNHQVTFRVDHGIIEITNSIFYFIYNTYQTHGGAINIGTNSGHTVNKLIMTQLGFIDCKTLTNYYGGAIYSETKQIQISNICPSKCRAPSTYFQMGYFKISGNGLENNFSHVSIYQCGTNNNGRTSLCFAGRFDELTVSYINSTSNFNYFGEYSYGCCFYLHEGSGHTTTFLNCVNCSGREILNTNFKSENDKGTFSNINIFNCSGYNIMKYLGINTIDNGRFGKLSFSNELFRTGGTFIVDRNRHFLTLKNCYIDVANPLLPVFTNHLIIEKLTHQSPIETINMFNSLQPFDYCLYSMSYILTKSEVFTQSMPFTTSELSPSTFPPTILTRKPTSSFTPSDPFTPSFTFSPEKTKYPDGMGQKYHYANVTERNIFQSTPSAAALGTVSSLLLLVIGVSVFLMLVYLRNRHREIQQRQFGYFNDFLDSSTDSSDSYSYSFYTYEYYSTSADVDEEDHTDNQVEDSQTLESYSTETESGYSSDFNNSLLDSEIDHLLSDSANSV